MSNLLRIMMGIFIVGMVLGAGKLSESPDIFWLSFAGFWICVFLKYVYEEWGA